MKRTTVIEWLIVGSAGVVGLVAWGWMTSAESARLTPPPSATTLEAFADCMPPPQRLAAIKDGGATRVIWIGETAMWSLASGPSCYVFDANGKLVQWDWETGDGQTTTRFLQPAWEADPLTIQQAIDLIGGHRAPNTARPESSWKWCHDKRMGIPPG